MASIWPMFRPLLAFATATAIALLVRAALLLVLRRWTSPSPVATAAALVRAPSLLWSVALGLYIANDVALSLSLLPARWHVRIGLLLEAVVLLSVTLVLASLAAHAVARVSERSALGAGVTGLAQTTSRVVVVIVGSLVVLTVVGVQITPLLTALGVGGLAVALALQDTLANVFAGVHLLADRPFRVGDYVKAGDAGEGFVVDIGWRSTRIRSLANNIVVIPNQTVAKAAITNYSLPDSRVSVSLKVSVEYSVDPDRVTAVLEDELAKALDTVPGLLREPPPGVSLVHGFGEYSLDFTVAFSVATFVDQYPVQHELRKRILDRFRREGIAIATPTRVTRLGVAPSADEPGGHRAPEGQAGS
ncbi:MAG TPA: mechanosensitive ion channel family protein [Methylomirabilota bacterium]|jgi:small-conductance mechanosensitive channel|nr:mechanosensitive ion channel family protein [Methylomirabilota bacterium]